MSKLSLAHGMKACCERNSVIKDIFPNFDYLSSLPNLLRTAFSFFGLFSMLLLPCMFCKKWNETLLKDVHIEVLPSNFHPLPTIHIDLMAVFASRNNSTNHSFLSFRDLDIIIIAFCIGVLHTYANWCYCIPYHMRKCVVTQPGQQKGSKTLMCCTWAFIVSGHYLGSVLFGFFLL